MISVALLLYAYPCLGLALTECRQWRSQIEDLAAWVGICKEGRSSSPLENQVRTFGHRSRLCVAARARPKIEKRPCIYQFLPHWITLPQLGFAHQYFWQVYATAFGYIVWDNGLWFLRKIFLSLEIYGRRVGFTVRKYVIRSEKVVCWRGQFHSQSGGTPAPRRPLKHLLRLSWQPLTILMQQWLPLFCQTLRQSRVESSR